MKIRSFDLVSSSAGLLLLALGSVLGCATPEPEGEVLEFTNGTWFDGEGFEARTVWSIAGRIALARPGRVDSVLDLAGGFVVPGFAEAHNHNVESSRFEDVNRMYLEDGIFYIKNPNSLTSYTDPIRERLAEAGTVDAIFAGGGLTCSGGHPIPLAERMIGRGIWKAEDGDGGFFWVVDNQADLDARWSTFIEGQHDFVKAYLLYSEDFEARMADESTRGWRGLDPALIPEIVERAHAAGLRVSAHVETAHDFHVAVEAGVDEVNHLPGFRPDEEVPIERYQIDEADARTAAEKGIVVVTTIGATMETLDRLAGGPEAAAAVPYRELVAHNLRVLHDNGVQLAIGSDRYEQTAAPEAMALSRLDIFTNAELLGMWCETTPRAIFPDRQIGRFEEGWEASFLVLEGNPIEDFAHVRRISLRVKQGRPIALPPREED